MRTVTKPSDFPRDERFRDPGTAPYRDEDGTYHVFSHAEVMRVLRNEDEAFSRERSSWLAPEAHHMSADFMWAFEPFTVGGNTGRHDALRAVVEPWFRTRAVRTMEPLIRELAVELLEEIVAKGTGELNLARELAYRLTMRVICRLCGFDLDREPWLHEKVEEISRAPSIADHPPQWDVQAYFWQLVAKRLARPRDELLDVLVLAWRDGTISDNELLGYMFGFVAAGAETTGTSLVNAFALLSEFGRLDDLRGRLDDERALRRVVEEILRFGTPFPALTLFTLKQVAFGKLVVPAGSVLKAWFVAANRDQAVNGGVDQSPPTVFDPNRWPNRHVGLGHGRHYCLGAELARLETRILLQEGLRRLPDLRLDETKPFTRHAGIVDGVTEAPFKFDQQDAERIASKATPAGSRRDAHRLAPEASVPDGLRRTTALDEL